MDSAMDRQGRRKASSFSHSSSSVLPEQKQLKHTLSTPAMPSVDEDSDDSSPRSKYSPRTRSQSDGSDVRWYFCKTPLRPDEAAASVPSTELVGKGEYFRFSKSDSDALEAAFLEREEELVRAWWKEYGESREGPSSNGNSSRDSGEAGGLSQTGRDDFESIKLSQMNQWEEEENVGVLVKGGLYEVDLVSRRCLPVYWRGDHRRVLRGHWFARKGGLDWLPMREDLSEQLEIAYESQIWRRRRFQPSGLYAARVNLHGASPGLHALFTGEDHSWEAWLCVDTTGISLVLGLRGGGVKLRRGFALPETPQPTQDELRQHKEEEMDDYASKVPVRHVIFMVHGIGQRLEKANLVDDVGAFRRSVAMLAEQHLTKYQRDSQRVLFIPCQWRRELKLGGESSVEDCTLEGVRALRTMLSATVHDVLYYMSPVYCQDIIDSVSKSLNRLYRKFVRRNPNYDGKVSIYGHSLGTVLSYDILCHQTDDSSTSVAPITSLEQVNKHQKDRTDQSSTSAAPVTEVETDDCKQQKDRTDESSTSAAQVTDFEPDVDKHEEDRTNELSTSAAPVTDVETDVHKHQNDRTDESSTSDAPVTDVETDVDKHEKDRTDESSTSAAPVPDVEPDVDKLEKDRTDESSTSAAPIPDVEPDVDKLQKNRTDDSKPSTASNVEVKPGASEACKEVLPSHSSEIENGVSPTEDSGESPSSDNVEKDSETESIQVQAELESIGGCDGQGQKVSSEVEANADRDVHGEKVSSKVEASAENDVKGEKVNSEVETNAESDVQEEKVSSEVETNAESDGQGEKVSSEVETNAESDVQGEKVSSEAEANAESDVQGEKVSSEVEANAESDVQGGKISSEVEALKAEVKMLQEKLYTLTKQKSIEAESSSSPPFMRSSHHASFSISEDDDSRQPDGESAHLEDPQTIETPATTATGDGPLDRRSSSNKHFTPYISYTKLNFEVDTFYAVGSPLGVFLSLRNIRIGVGSGQEYWGDDGIEEEMPAVRQMMNIFHPYDPVAYRVEPLICREFVTKRPKFIPYHKGGKRLHIGYQEFQEDLSARSKAIVDSISSVGTRVANNFFHNQVHKTEEKAKKEKTYGAKMMERLTGGPDGRVDFQLQDSTFEHPYLAVLSSHTAYWHDLDTALFILKHLYRDVPEEPPPPPATPASLFKSGESGPEIIDEDSEVPDMSSLDEEAGEAVKSQEDSDLEDLSLTFSSKDQIAAALADANKVKADWMG